LGCGTIGLLACALAQTMGASRVVVVDLIKARLDFAKSNGFASQTYCASSSPTDKAKTTDDQLRRAKEAAQSILAEFKAPEGFDVVFECTGAEPVIQMSVHVSFFSYFCPLIVFRLTVAF
jgi:L-iditol 2-dehydrogenase